MTWDVVAQVLVLVVGAVLATCWLGREPKPRPAALSRRGARRMDAKHDPFAVWAVWDQGCNGWVLAHPEDERSARWMHPEDIHPVCGDFISTEERRAAWAAGVTHGLPPVK